MYVKGKVQKRLYNEDQLEFKVKDIQLLSDLVDKDVRNIVLEVDINDITDDLIHKIETVTNKKGGKHSLIIQINNNQKKYALELLSRNRKLNIDKQFIQEIEKIGEVGLKIT